MDVDAVETRLDRPAGTVGEGGDRRLDLRLGRLLDHAAGQRVGDRRGRQGLDAERARLAAGVRDLGEDPRARRLDRTRQFGEARDHCVVVDPDLRGRVATPRFAEEMAGQHQADVMAAEARVEIEQRWGDASVRLGHRLRGPGADEPVADPEIAEPPGLEER